jgi:hypothetical protein
MAAICVNVAAAAVTGPKASALQGGAGATAAAAATTTTTTTTRTRPSRNGVHASHISCSSSSSTFAAPGFCNIARRRTPAIRHSSSVRTLSTFPCSVNKHCNHDDRPCCFCAFLQEMLLYVHDCKQIPKTKNKRGDSVLSHKCITNHKRKGKDKTERNKSERQRQRQRQRQRFLLDQVKSVPCGR